MTSTTITPDEGDFFSGLLAPFASAYTFVKDKCGQYASLVALFMVVAFCFLLSVDFALALFWTIVYVGIYVLIFSAVWKAFGIG